MTLSAPLRLASGDVLPNRLAKAAMSETLGDLETGAPTDDLIRLYERWGKSGAGVLITGNVMVDRGGLGEPGNVIVEDDRHLAALKRWADAAQAHGAKLWMQINHAGRQSPRRLSKHPVAPSAVAMKGFFGMFAKPRALAEREIEQIIARFATTSQVARAAGFAGVEIHGAHGYLVSQFLSPLTNLRDDAWGGDAPRRRRFALEIVRAIRRATGADFTIAFKLNSADFQRGGFELGEAIEVAKALEAEGVDLIEISGGTYEKPAMSGSEERASTKAREAYFLEYAREIRAATTLPLMLTGGLRSASAMTDAIASKAVDVVGLARPMTYEPELPARLLSGAQASATPIEIRTRIRRITDLAQVAWYQQQMLRIAAGDEPDLTMTAWQSVWRSLRRMMRKTPRAVAPRPALESA
ncbi:MAG TPA: NADH:flavin oxidoreductase/NADH oxidase family protein [Kofleriaceae bacterium]|nr:NADH:flavin oxidoreductase/NADH oxidase family protein [Kofleriaceae bacterium]